MRLIHDKGYDATSVQEIVAAAGVTKGGFYHYFRSKAELLRLIHQEFVDHELRRIRHIVATVEDPRDQLRATIRSLLQGVSRHRQQIVIFEQEWRYLAGDGYEDIRRKRAEIVELLTGQIERGIAAGVFSPHQPPRMVTFAIMGMCAWAYRWFRPNGALSSDEIADLWADMILKGIERTDDG